MITTFIGKFAALKIIWLGDGKIASHSAFQWKFLQQKAHISHTVHHKIEGNEKIDEWRKLWYEIRKEIVSVCFWRLTTWNVRECCECFARFTFCWQLKTCLVRWKFLSRLMKGNFFLFYSRRFLSLKKIRRGEEEIHFEQKIRKLLSKEISH